MLLFRRFRGLNTGWFVRSILDGEIRPCEKTNEKGLAAFRFARQPLIDYSRRLRRGPRGDYLGLPETAETLGLERNFAYTLVRVGLLRAQKVEDGVSPALVVSKQSVESFASTYRLLTRKDARELGTTTHRLVALLADRGIEPITGKEFGEGRYYLYVRAELEKIDLASGCKEEREKWQRARKRPKLLDSSRAAEALGVSIDEVTKLAEGGLLSPYRFASTRGEGDKGYFFTPYVISTYRKKPVGPAVDVISSSVAAGMLNESLGVFYERWVRTGRISPAPFRASKGKLLFYRNDIGDLASLKNGVSKSSEAGNGLNLIGRTGPGRA